MMRAVLGCLLMVAGAACGIQRVIVTEATMCIASGLVLAGLAVLLRQPASTPTGGDACRTCQGAGTVYSDEYNDWREPGPVQTVRELCPICEGIPADTG